jgi:hypothetical protein
MKGGRKAHLKVFAMEESSEDIALCGQPLPANVRRGSAATIGEPFGDECNACLRRSGYLKKPEQTREERRLELIVKIARHLKEELGMTASDVKDVIFSIGKGR